MKIVENNVKRGEIRIFDRKFCQKTCKFSFKFCPRCVDLVKKFCRWVGVFERKFSSPKVSLGEGELVTGQYDTFISGHMLLVYIFVRFSHLKPDTCLL